MRRDRRTLLTIGALVILGVLGWTYIGSSPSAPAAGARQGSAARRSATNEGPLPAAESVRLAALEQGRQQPSDMSRNPFRFQIRRAAPVSGPTDLPPALALKPVEPAAPSGPPPPPAITLKFIGVVEKADGVKLAVLTPGDGHAPMHGTEGDIIDGRYRILKIGVESIELAYVDGRGKQTIRLTGQ